MARDSSRLSTTELLTAQFYDWERRGRGWQVYDAPVVLEPPYLPFRRSAVFGPSARLPDDGREETLASSVVSFFKNLVTAARPSTGAVPAFDEPVPTYDDGGTARTELSIVLPADGDVSREAAEQLLLSLSTCPSP